MNGQNDEPTEVLPLESTSKSFAAYRNIVILTGAGVSVASGIAPFRGPGGIWNDPAMERLAYPEILNDDPVSAWKFYSDLRGMAQKAMPNAAHFALANFERNLRPDEEFLLVTQNIDGLHVKAGSKNVVEMHGTIQRTKCSDPECSLAVGFEDKRIYTSPPYCPRCGSVLRPDLVMFGENIRGNVTNALRECDLFVAVGTSGTVYPANSFVKAARNAGAITVYINMEPLGSPMEEPIFQETIIGRAEQVLPRLLIRDLVEWAEFLSVVCDHSLRRGKQNISIETLLDKIDEQPWSKDLLMREEGYGDTGTIHITLDRGNIFTVAFDQRKEPSPYTVSVHGKQFGQLSIAALMKALQSWLSHLSKQAVGECGDEGV